MIILNTKRSAHKSNRTIQYCWCYFGLFFDIPSPWETFSNHPFNKMYLGTNWHDTLCDSQVLFENTNNKNHSLNEIWSSAPFLARLICHLGSGILPKGFGPSHKRILYSIAKKMKWIPDSALLLHDNISIKNNFLFFFFKNRNAQRCLTLFLWSQTPLLFRTLHIPQATSIKDSSCLTWPFSFVESLLLNLEVLTITVHFIWSWWEHYLCLEC